MTDGFSVFTGVIATLCTIAVLMIAYSVGADRVYQECKETGEYRASFKTVMKCEAVK